VLGGWPSAHPFLLYIHIRFSFLDFTHRKKQKTEQRKASSGSP
jgi:hypothetical protein